MSVSEAQSDPAVEQPVGRCADRPDLINAACAVITVVGGGRGEREDQITKQLMIYLQAAGRIDVTE